MHLRNILISRKTNKKIKKSVSFVYSSDRDNGFDYNTYILI